MIGCGRVYEIMCLAILITAILTSFAVGRNFGYNEAVTAVDCSLCVCKAVAGVP
jgi:hypothetical protein